MPLCLQESFTQELADMRVSADQLSNQLQWVNMRITNLQVSFMNTADGTVVITVISNFQIQIVLDLKRYMEYGKQTNSVLDA
jgi:hypothetical protein